MNAKVWALSALVVGGCAGAASPDYGDRFARLEARVGQLENGASGASDAGPGLNGSEPRFVASIMMNEAGAGESIHTYQRHYGGSDGGTGAAESYRSCLADAEQRCRLVVVQERSPSGLTWKRRISQAHAKDTPEGRSCLAGQQRQCEQVRHAAERIEQQFAKLDAELATGKVDSAFSARLARVLDQDGGAPLDVACIKQFCRVRGIGQRRPRLSTTAGLLGNSVSTMTYGDVFYVTRDGYEFPE